jgi:hypothetical protein
MTKQEKMINLIDERLGITLPELTMLNVENKTTNTLLIGLPSELIAAIPTTFDSFNDCLAVVRTCITKYTEKFYTDAVYKKFAAASIHNGIVWLGNNTNLRDLFTKNTVATYHIRKIYYELTWLYQDIYALRDTDRIVSRLFEELELLRLRFLIEHEICTIEEASNILIKTIFPYGVYNNANQVSKLVFQRNVFINSLVREKCDNVATELLSIQNTEEENLQNKTT